MNEDHERALCAVCLFFGTVVPWGLLVVGGIMAAISTSAYWSETAAYLAFSGLFFLAVSYLMMRVAGSRQH